MASLSEKCRRKNMSDKEKHCYFCFLIGRPGSATGHWTFLCRNVGNYINNKTQQELLEAGCCLSCLKDEMSDQHLEKCVAYESSYSGGKKCQGKMICGKGSCSYRSSGKSYQLNVKICKCRVKLAISHNEKSAQAGKSAGSAGKQTEQGEKKQKYSQQTFVDEDSQGETSDGDEDKDSDDQEYMNFLEDTAQNNAGCESAEGSSEEYDEELERDLELAYGDPSTHFNNARFSQLAAKSEPGTAMTNYYYYYY
jgi:hypothetical protein